jgi:V/A-type H+-transporting ATPase subunit E
MDSLNKIISKIEADNKAECKAVLDNAEKQAKQILSDAEKQAEIIKSDILAKGEKAVSDKLSKAKSSAELIAKRQILSAKVDITKATIEKALNELKNLPEKEYFDILSELVIAHAESGEGTLCLTDEDKARAPKDFAKNINARLDGKGSVTLVGGAELGYGGFILRYEETLHNCGFDALLDDVLDDVKDNLSTILF